MIRAIKAVLTEVATVLIAAAIAIGFVLFTMRMTHAESMVASYYGSESGKRTASGRPFRPAEMTAASKTLPFGTRVKVCLDGCVSVVVTDRGPFVRGRGIDLSSGAAARIGLTRRGVARVNVELVQ